MSNNKYVQVDGHPGLVRDKHSGAIVNVNSQEMANARTRKKKWKQQEQELDTLRADVQAMKEMLAQLIEDRNGDNNS